MRKLAIIFGGQSSEHEISIISATNVSKQVVTSKYELIFIGITKEGRWLKVDSIASIEDGSWLNSKTSAYILPDATKKCIMIETDGEYKEIAVDVVFPVMHGLYGEDGTIQGLLELADIPYVGCGVLASAVGMDKLYTKLVVDKLGIRQAAYEPVLDYEVKDDFKGVIKRIEDRFEYPVFVKPSNAGSSKGVSKASDREELEKGIIEALNHDRKILVEETIVGHEVECGVLGRPGNVMASGVGEIKSATTFYDYDAKYKLGSLTLLDSKLPDGVREKLPECAKKIFTALDGFGLSRVDFFAKEDGEIVFNEINTMPGFTAISMYPMLFEAAGIDKKVLIDRLIELAFERG
jgi:D-ala D-ala ligase N-terminal domain protein